MSDCVPRSKIHSGNHSVSPGFERGEGTITHLTNRLPDPLVLEGPGAVSVKAQPQAPVIDRLSAQISVMLQDLDETDLLEYFLEDHDSLPGYPISMRYVSWKRRGANPESWNRPSYCLRWAGRN